MKDNPLFRKSYAFALKSIILYKSLIHTKREYILSKQLLECTTSIGSNVAEANGAISTSDFSAKISIAYKESLEAKYWISLLKDSDYVSEEEASFLINDADELSRIMFSIIKTTRLRKK